jgi:hypothetical protein
LPESANFHLGGPKNVAGNAGFPLRVKNARRLEVQNPSKFRSSGQGSPPKAGIRNDCR